MIIDINKFIISYNIVEEDGVIEFFDSNGLAFTLKYFDGSFDFNNLANIPKVYKEAIPECASNGSYLLKSTSNGFDVYYKKDDELILVFDSLVYYKALESIYNSETIADGSKPITVFDNVKVASFNGSGVDLNQDFDAMFFNDAVIADKIDTEKKIVNIIANHRDLYVVDEDSVIYLYTRDVDIMGIDYGPILTPLGKSDSFLDRNGVIVAGHFVRLDGSKIIVTKLNESVDVEYELDDIGTYTNILLAQGHYSTASFILDNNNKITIKRLNVSEAIIEPYTIDTNITKYTDNIIYTTQTDSQSNNIQFTSKVNSSNIQLPIPDGAIDYLIYDDYTIVFLYSDGTISTSSVTIENPKDIHVVDNNEIFLESNVLCKYDYMEVQDIRASTIQNSCVMPDYLETWGTAYGLTSCDGFAICESNDIAVQIENGYDRYMSIIDVSNRVISLKNPYKLVKLKYHAAVAVAIYKDKIFVAFSDRKIVEYNLLGVYQTEYDLSQVINHEIQDMTSNCSTENGLYIMTSITNTIYRFSGDDFTEFCHSLIVENQTDRTSFATTGLDKFVASSTSVSTNKILGIDSNGELNNLYQFDNDEIVNMDIDNNKLYVLTAYYPFALKEYLI